MPDTLVVCGVLEGDLTVGNLIVGETGAIKSRITVAENAEISGKVFEKLDVKRLLILRSTGRVDGNIRYGLLQNEQGASIAGGLSSTVYLPEQKPPKVDVYPKDHKAQKPEGRGSKSAGLSPAGDSGRASRRTVRPRPTKPADRLVRRYGGYAPSSADHRLYALGCGQIVFGVIKVRPPSRL